MEDCLKEAAPSDYADEDEKDDLTTSFLNHSPLDKAR